MSLTERQIDNRCRSYLDIKAQIKDVEKKLAELKSAKDALEYEIVACTIDSKLTTKKFTAKWSEWTECRLDTARLQEAMPDIKAQYPLYVPKHRLTVKEVIS